MGETSSRIAWTLCGLLLLATEEGALAATPPPLTHYQGVLRGADDAPRNGDHDMVFAFFDAESGGNEILVDSHLAADGQAVTVDRGLFSVALGAGQVTDGSGPGTYAALTEVFRDHAGVWLEVRIGGETLAPRTRVLASGYALNATSAADSTLLAGQPAGFFLDTSATTQTKLGQGRFDNSAGAGFGTEALGPTGGGYFRDSDHSGYAYVGYVDYGIQAGGTTLGGYFHDSNSSGVTYAGYGDYGIQGYGNAAGGFFQDLNPTAYAYVGSSGRGVQAYGSQRGGEFHDTDNSAYAYVAYQDDGIQAYGGSHGGYFSTIDATGWARVAYDGFGGFGIMAYGYGGGGFFSDRDGSYAYAGYGAYKVYGTGTVSFVQNHPTRNDRTIVYAAPEGDEVAVYTRGSGRLVNGEARVTLGETFAFVANPDLGVTAHVTPRGDARLWVEQVSPSELVVRGPSETDVDFDYIVYALRIGFEALPIVQVKKDEAYLPTAATLAEYEAGQTDTVASSALVRFSAERERLGRAPADLTRAGALSARINAGREEWLGIRKSEDEQRRAGVPHGTSSHEPSSSAPASVAVEARPVAQEPVIADGAPLRWSALFTTASPIDAGDVVVVEPGAPESVRRADRAFDRTVVGIAVGPPVDGRVEVAMGAVVEVRVDATQGAILAGDLLVSSPTPGAAMRATVAEPGTILGKALEPSRPGAETIRALVTLR